MSFQVLENPGSVSGRIGKGFAKGLADTVPKEVERMRLSSGLKKLGEQDLTGKNQLQTLGEIYNIPGITPEIAKLAQQQVQKQNFIDRSPTDLNTKSNESTTGKSNKSRKAVQDNGFASPSQITEYKKNILQEPESAEIRDLAKDYLSQGLTQDTNEAMALARQELGQNRVAQQSRNTALRKDLDERLKLELQGQGFGDYKDISGEIQKQLMDQGEYMVNELGFSPEQAAEKTGQIALELAKSANNLADTGGFWNMFRKSSTKSQELKQQREEFSKYGFGEQFDDLAASHLGITPLQAAHILDPLDNKGIENEIGNLKKVPGTSDRKLKEEILDTIIRQIKPKDSLYDIEWKLRDKGYDVNQFKKRVQDLSADKQISLSDQQKHQQKRAISNSFLGDILYESF